MFGPSDVSTWQVIAAHVPSEEFKQKLINFWDMPISKEDETELDEERCEKLFQAKHYREKDEHYVVPSPCHPEKIKLWNSFH